MKIKYLGTAAAEGMPALFCHCRLCDAARKKGGKEIRTRSQILIDDDMLIDFPMDSYMHSLTYGLDLSAVKNVLITHAHMDHCYPQDFTTHGEPFAHNMTCPEINVYGNETVIDKFISYTKDEIKPQIRQSVVLHRIKPYEKILLSDATVTALPAVHTVGEDCLLYSIQRGGKSALIMNDTGILSDDTYDKMKAMNLTFDLVSFDCTYGGKGKGSGRHMGLPDNISERRRMQERALVHDKTRYIITHFSHNSGLTHDELCSLAQQHGMTAACDGMEIEI